MEMDLLQAVAQVGFPIAVASFVLVRLDVTIKANTECMQEMVLLLKEGVK